MDSRIELSPNTRLRFGPETLFTIKNEVGRGGSCIVYDAVYRTNAGDEKIVRIKECYPFDIPLEREPSGALICPEPAAEKFTGAKMQMYADFRLCNRLFYSEDSADSIINTINIYEANNTVYVVSAWARENVLSSLKPDSLRECVSILRQTASAIRSIHRAGYLYLDIKPDNISVIRGSSSRIQLFDFNSLIPVSEMKEGFSSFLSYTKGFAALELRRGQFSKLGFCTDVYGLGALMFYLLFGKVPEAPDCVQDAVYDLSRMNYSGSWPDKLLFNLETFFRKTLAAFPPDRWQQMDDVIHALEAIERLADPVYPYLFTAPIDPPAYFIGRAFETETLETWYRDDDRQTLFITGMGGIGKSTFIRHFLAKHRGEWDSICFLYFHNTLRKTITDDKGLKINGTQRFPEEKETDYFERKLTKLQEIIERDRVLLVIDNFEEHHDPDLNRILELNCRKIFISRQPFGSLNLPVLKLGSIQNEDDLLRLFIHYLDRDTVPEEISSIREIIRQLDGHTLGIELFARQISYSFLTLSEASELLRQQGLLHAGSERVDYLRDSRISYEHLESIITRLFETDSLSSEQIALLKGLTLFPAPGIESGEFLRLAGIDSPESVLSLVRYGWITEISGQHALTADHNIFLHPLIRDVIRDLLITDKTGENAQNVLRTLYGEITSESHKEEINLSALRGTSSGAVPSRDFLQQPDCPMEGLDLYKIITDHHKLDRSVSIARGVIDALTGDICLAGSPPAQKLAQAMVVNLPKHEDEAILNYGMCLLDHPEHLDPLELLEVIEQVEKACLSHQDYDAAVRLMERAVQYVKDERTKAEFFGLEGNIYDYRNAPGDHEKMISCLEKGIEHARLAPPPERKHLLAEYLLGKLNVFTRSRIENQAAIDELIRELMDIIEKECLPYSEIRFGFASAMGFYWAEIGEDLEETGKWITAARTIGEKLYPAGLDFIDNCIIPPAIMYIDLQAFDASEASLLEGIRICDDHPDLIAYIRKKNDLHRCLLDVYLESGNRKMLRRTLSVYDNECKAYGFPDTVFPEIREFSGKQ